MGTRKNYQTRARQGRMVAILLACTGLVWLGAQVIGASAGWSHRTLAFFDLAALAGFAMALWLVFGLWRARQDEAQHSKD